MTTDAPHILIVDDDAKIRQMLTRYLTDEGFQVSSVAKWDDHARVLGTHKD